jgi:curved DNA-binding protein CbpA
METISKCFGSPVDLHRDVLKVSSVADARELRIGYFRRGREVLTDAGLSGLDGLSDASKLPDGAKATFQAVSMAYEILSKPEWKEQYLRDGLRSQPPRDGDQPMNDATSTVVLQDSRPTIRWNEQVEELVYEREPHEEAELVEWTNKRKRKKPKAKIMMDEEDEELDEHLAKLDAQAKAHFTHDFLDSLEESLDGLLRFTGKRRDKKTNRRDDDDDYDDDDDDAYNNVDNDDDDEPSVDDDDNNEDENSLTDAVPSESPVKTASSNDDDSLVGVLTSHLMRLRAGGSKNRTTVDASLVPLSHTEATDPFRCVSPIPSPATSPDDELFDVAAELASKSDKNIIPDDVFDGIEDENLRQPSSITLPRRRPPSPSNVSTVSDLSESVVTARSQLNGAFVLTPGGSAVLGDRSSIQASHHSVSKSVAKEIFEEAPEDEFLEDVDDWFQISNAISNVFSFGGKDNNNNDNKGSAVVTPEKVPGQQKSSQQQQQDDEGFMGALAAFVQEVARECTAMGQNFAKSTDAVVDACKIDENDLHQLMRILNDEVKQAPPLERKDAVQSPTLFAMEAAKSFS